IQDAIIVHIEEEARAQRPLRQQGRKLLSALQARTADGNAVTDEQMRTLLTAFQAALEDDLDRTLAAEAALDEKIGYTRNPRLEAMLILLGLIGNGPPVMALGIPGQPNGPGQYGLGQWEPNNRGGLTPKQRREQREALQREAMLKRFDKDGDGLLDAAERAEAEAVVKTEQNPPDGAVANGAAPPQPAPALAQGEAVGPDAAPPDAAPPDATAPEATPNHDVPGEADGAAAGGDGAEALPEPEPDNVE
ncbi:MAG TPA: hypothetical protein VNA16_10540, partial [Abditibacteriaceae bacterium]|nr:hypothetical protein [Abditibacteriaceae bacterium]